MPSFLSPLERITGTLHKDFGSDFIIYKDVMSQYLDLSINFFGGKIVHKKKKKNADDT